MGLSLHYPSSPVNSWVAIIPNSQLILFPYPLTSPADWTLELFISPSASLTVVAVAWTITLVVIGGIIVFFHAKERKQDSADHVKADVIVF